MRAFLLAIESLCGKKRINHKVLHKGPQRKRKTIQVNYSQILTFS
jgi:hypothetical protein